MQGFITQGKKLKLEHEADDEDVGDVTDEDEAADIDQEAAASLLQEKSAEGGDGPSTTAPTTTDTPPCLLYTSPSPRDLSTSRMPSSA